MKLISIVIPYKKINNSTYLWCQRRESKDSLSGLLEFPGGKVEKEESTIFAALREVKEEVGIELKEEDLKLFGSFEFGNITLFTYFYEDGPNKFAQAGYYDVSQLIENRFEVMPNNISLLKGVKRYFEEFLHS